MIPFGSQRALGQDLATHLLNAQDNEYLEIAQVRGAVAQDLHGAFAEWEVQAEALTRCRQYLYSLSVNPDPRQGQLSRAQYLDYIDRVEERLGLSGQPRAVVFHIKHGREHCHVVWSRTDVEAGKARHIAFDREKLMMVTRQFARDHGLSLPDGYFADRDDDRAPPLTLYEKQQERETGISKEERITIVTETWRQSDSPRAFVQALQQHGYILATGKRPYVLVDIYGQVNALPKLIDDRSVRTKDIRAFLEQTFPPESLPTVDEAKALAARHRKAQEDFATAQARSDRRDALKRMQAERRLAHDKERGALMESQRRERLSLDATQLDDRRCLKASYLAEAKRIRVERARRRPTGLAAFLGRVTGVSILINKLHKHHDRQRLRSHLLELDALKNRQRNERSDLQHAQKMQLLDLERRGRALDQLEKRELKSLETLELQERRVDGRRGHEHMPALALELKPRGRRAVPHKAKNRHTSRARFELGEAFEHGKHRRSHIDLSSEFSRVAGDDTDGRGEAESGDGPKPVSDPKPKRARRRRPRDRDRDPDRGL